MRVAAQRSEMGQRTVDGDGIVAGGGIGMIPVAGRGVSIIVTVSPKHPDVRRSVQRKGNGRPGSRGGHGDRHGAGGQGHQPGRPGREPGIILVRGSGGRAAVGAVAGLDGCSQDQILAGGIVPVAVHHSGDGERAQVQPGVCPQRGAAAHRYQ